MNNKNNIDSLDEILDGFFKKEVPSTDESFTQKVLIAINKEKELINAKNEQINKLFKTFPVEPNKDFTKNVLEKINKQDKNTISFVKKLLPIGLAASLAAIVVSIVIKNNQSEQSPTTSNLTVAANENAIDKTLGANLFELSLESEVSLSELIKASEIITTLETDNLEMFAFNE